MLNCQLLSKNVEIPLFWRISKKANGKPNKTSYILKIKKHDLIFPEKQYMSDIRTLQVCRHLYISLSNRATFGTYAFRTQQGAQQFAALDFFSKKGAAEPSLQRPSFL